MQLILLSNSNTDNHFITFSSYVDDFHIRDTVIIWDDDYHECYRIYDEVNEIVFNRNGEYIESETPYSMLINSSSTQQDIASSLSDPRTSIYEVGPATPIMPYFTGVCEFVDDWFGYFTFPENYWALTEPIVDVPYSFDDDQDIIFLGFSHEIFFYWPWESIGIRSIYKYNGEVHYSDIKWHNHFPSGVDEIITEDGGDVVATEYYDLMGRKVAKPENGVYIKVSIMDNGTRRGEKVLIKK